MEIRRRLTLKMVKNKSSIYKEDYFLWQELEAEKSAEVIVRIVLDLLKPKSVIDIGCGVGAWLSVFQKHGVHDIFGVDGEWINKKLLKIPEEKFLSYNLTQPLNIKRTFDLAVSLEVAEHLESNSAKIFVESLTNLAPAILFSAAIPFQGGKSHINEQWPGYWEKRFREKGYVVIDYIRRKIWSNENVAWWYRQNILLFVKREYLKRRPKLLEMQKQTTTSQLAIVHPENYLEAVSLRPLKLYHERRYINTPLVLVGRRVLGARYKIYSKTFSRWLSYLIKK